MTKFARGGAVDWLKPCVVRWEADGNDAKISGFSLRFGVLSRDTGPAAAKVCSTSQAFQDAAGDWQSNGLDIGRHRCDQFPVTADYLRCRHPRPRSAAGAADSPQPVEKASICITLITWPKQKVHRKAYMILPKPSIVGTTRAEPRDHREWTLDQLWHSMQLKSAC
jgi:hypothetical protein